MFSKALVTPVALAFGLALSGAAFAQTVVGGNTITDEQLPYVQSYCDELAAREAAADQSATSDGDLAEREEIANEISGSEGVFVGFNLSTLTATDCREAGLIE